jgi:hypothetical protein
MEGARRQIPQATLVFLLLDAVAEARGPPIEGALRHNLVFLVHRFRHGLKFFVKLWWMLELDALRELIRLDS